MEQERYAKIMAEADALVARVERELAGTDRFKFNVAFVIIDFLIRHGFIGPEDPAYLEIVRSLRRRPAVT